jgi:hypothetical protein
MGREPASRCQLREGIALHHDSGGRNATPAFGQTGSNISAVDNRPARIFVVEDDPVMLRMIVSLIWCSTPSGHGNGLRP